MWLPEKRTTPVGQTWLGFPCIAPHGCNRIITKTAKYKKDNTEIDFGSFVFFFQFISVGIVTGEYGTTDGISIFLKIMDFIDLGIEKIGPQCVLNQ